MNTNNNQSEGVERMVTEFVSLAKGVKSRIEQQRTPNEVGANSALQILIDNYKRDITTHGASEYARGKSEERERIIKAIRADKNENAENGGEWANGYNAGKFISVNCALSQENTLKE